MSIVWKYRSAREATDPAGLWRENRIILMILPNLGISLPARQLIVVISRFYPELLDIDCWTSGCGFNDCGCGASRIGKRTAKNVCRHIEGSTIPPVAWKIEKKSATPSRAFPQRSFCWAAWRIWSFMMTELFEGGLCWPLRPSCFIGLILPPALSEVTETPTRPSPVVQAFWLLPLGTNRENKRRSSASWPENAGSNYPRHELTPRDCHCHLEQASFSNMRQTAEKES